MKSNEEGKGNELSDYPEFHQRGCEEIREFNKKKGKKEFCCLFGYGRREGEKERGREKKGKRRERNFVVVMALIGLLEKVWFRVW